MKLGLIGLGKMGLQLGLNMLEHGHSVVGFDTNAKLAQRFSYEGGTSARDLSDMLNKLDAPRVLFIMLPQGQVIDDVLAELVPQLRTGDIVIDGGNSYYKDSVRRAEELKVHGVTYFDVGTSGGVSGARKGACYTIGGDEIRFPEIEPLFLDTSVPGGYLYTGPSGSGHFAKMVHNGIEYGMMQAIGEGFELLNSSPFDFSPNDIAHVWSNGSVIRGWLMELTEQVFDACPDLSNIRGIVHSSGEGKWAVEEALSLNVSLPVIALSLMARYRSQKEDTFSDKIVASLRSQFGGHSIETKNSQTGTSTV